MTSEKNFNGIGYEQRTEMMARIIGFFREKRELHNLGFDLHTKPRYTNSEMQVVFKLTKTMNLVKFIVGENGCFVHHLRRNPQAAQFILETHKLARNERFLPDALDKQLDDAWNFIGIPTDYHKTMKKIKAVKTIKELELCKDTGITDVVLCAKIVDINHEVIKGIDFVQYHLDSGEVYSIPNTLVNKMRHLTDRGDDMLVVNAFADCQIYTAARSPYVFSYDHNNLEVIRGNNKEINTSQKGCQNSSEKASC